MIRSNFFILLRLTSASVLSHHRNVLSPLQSLTHHQHHRITYQDPPWKKILKDNEQPNKDQPKEKPNKGACDIVPSKKVSGDILPHILKLWKSAHEQPQHWQMIRKKLSFSTVRTPDYIDIAPGCVVEERIWDGM